MQVYMQADGMKGKNLIIFLVVLLVFTNCFNLLHFSENSRADSPPTLYVGENEIYTSIQDAIDNSSAGYRVIVYNGTYNENLIINHKLDLFGEDKSNTKIIGDGIDDTIKINAQDVHISHFTIENSGSTIDNALIRVNESKAIITDNVLQYGYHGIILNNCNYHIVYDNEITNNNGEGVKLNNSNYVDISYNIISYNNNGIYLYLSTSNWVHDNIAIEGNAIHGIFINNSCTSNIIQNSNISDNARNGIYLNDYCNDNEIVGNWVYSNSGSGISLENCSSNIVDSNMIDSNTLYGLMIVGSYNTVETNIIKSNKEDGIFLTADDHTNITNSNKISYNSQAGIRLYNSTSDLIRGNDIFNNYEYGIYLDYFTLNNLVYNNFLHDNTKNAVDKSPNKNKWNISQTNTTNIAGGLYTAGNCWGDFDEKSEGCYDTNDDGLADSSYNIYASNHDEQPLIDMIPPIIDIPSATPAIKIAGDYVTISVEATDNLKLAELYVFITDPNDVTNQVSIINNKNDDTYSYMNKFSNVGDYTYYISAKDARYWNNSTTYSFEVKPGSDTKPPVIIIDKQGPSFDVIPNSYTYGVTVIDDSEISSVYMEYWYDDLDKTIAYMDEISDNYYEKTIIVVGSPDRVYCVIYAKDIGNNIANTKKPVADAGGPYTGNMAQDITFNGADSFDLDGDIIEYSWDFGDGNIDTGASLKHKYFASGSYTATLTVKDEEGYTNSDTAEVTIKSLVNITASNITVNAMENKFGINLSEPFLSYDTDGDGKVDSFVDPNGILEAEHAGYVTTSGHISFLLSLNGNLNKLVIWDVEYDKLINVDYREGKIDKTINDTKNYIEKIKFTVKNSDWKYIKVEDVHPHNSDLTVEGPDGNDVPSDRVWRQSNKVCIIDNKGTTYYLKYPYTPPPITLENAVFTPETGSVISDRTTRSITISYNIPVDLDYVELYIIPEDTQIPDFIEDISDEIITTNNMTFTYTPSNKFSKGVYQIFIKVTEKSGTNYVEDSVIYGFQFTDQQAIDSSITSFFIMLGIFGGAILLLYFVMKYKNIALESFVYIKNKKIIPFFKPVVVGPLSINVDSDKVSKAEFYVDGKLKETLIEPPYNWQWNERSFMKHNIETKIYDQEGNSNSSGEMSFYVFNMPKFFK